ncbi:MAG: tetrathionate reductase family octaheme c-type cytochrome [Reinekea sp.]
MSIDSVKPLSFLWKWLLFCFLSLPVTTVEASSTADHSQFEVLQQEFSDVEDINAACVSCHNQAESQIHATIHWQWTYPLERDDTRKTVNKLLGKLNVINGYHPNVASNISACGSCHIGYGLSKKITDTIPKAAVDCLACHDTTGEYFYSRFHQDGVECSMCHDDNGEANKDRVEKEGGRYTLSLTQMAQKVGETSVSSCGSCHFYDGGADGAKHGDLDSALIHADFEMDVHMSPDGAGLKCSDCHHSNQHALAGSRYKAMSPVDNKPVSALEGSRATCVSCHGDHPMKDEKLNDHTDVVACQTCHIPHYARNGISVKTSWDWSTAGELNRKRRPIAKHDEQGNVEYSSAKGTMTYGENLQPTYQWYDGILDYQTVGALVNPDGVTPLNASHTQRDGVAKVFPFHVFESKLPFDTQSNQLLPMHLSSSSRNAFWNGYDWDKSLKAGARAVGMDFSGDFDFTDVETVRALNHTVAPVEQALQCVDCHSVDGLLNDVPDLYVPGSRPHAWLDRMGLLVLLATLAGVLLHGLVRIIFALSRK